jgi:hypothetical protein
VHFSFLPFLGSKSEEGLKLAQQESIFPTKSFINFPLWQTEHKIERKYSEISFKPPRMYCNFVPGMLWIRVEFPPFNPLERAWDEILGSPCWFHFNNFTNITKRIVLFITYILGSVFYREKTSLFFSNSSYNICQCKKYPIMHKYEYYETPDP